MGLLIQGKIVKPFMSSDAKPTSTAGSASARLDALLRATPDSVVTVSTLGVIESANPATERMFGFSGREIIGQPVTMLLSESNRKDFEVFIDRPREGGTPTVIGRAREISALRKDGSTFPVEIVLDRFGEQDKVSLLGIIRDITEEKKSRSGYLQKTSELHTIFEILPDCFFRISREGAVLDYHAGQLARCHRSGEAPIGKNISSLFPQEIAERYRTSIARVNETLQPAQFRFELGYEPSEPVFEARLIPFLQQQIIVVVRELPRRDGALSHYSLLAEALPVGFFLTDANGDYTYVNERWCEIAHIPAEAAKRDGWSKVIHPDDKARILAQWRQCVSKTEPFTSEFRFLHPDGIVAWVYCQGVMERFTDGSPSGYVGTITDITDRIKADEALRRAHIELELRVEERTADVRAKNRYLQEAINKQKRVEKALREERNFISTVLETAGALVVVCDREGRVQQFNRSCQNSTGYTFDEVKDKYLWDMFLPAEEIETTKQIFQQLVGGKERIDHEGDWLTRDGVKRLISWSNTTIRDVDNTVTYVICIGIDITEQRQAEEEARQRQAELVHVSRLCTMGEMAAGMAHELNQPLAAIVSYTQGCVRRIASGASQPHELLDAMKQVTLQAQRAGEIIKHLRNFVSKGELQRTNVNPNTMVREVLSMAKIDIRKHGVTVRLRLTDQLPTVNVDMVQIEQVLLNLVRNGMEAMASATTQERELAVRTFLNDKNQVECSVADVGEGLAPNIEPEQLFDAFFTTKKEGMGMGLAISRSIIEAHGGRLWATRNPDRGMTFQFTLPV